MSWVEKKNIQARLAHLFRLNPLLNLSCLSSQTLPSHFIRIIRNLAAIFFLWFQTCCLAS